MPGRKVLFVVEGERDDPRFLRKLIGTFFEVRPENVFSYGTNIHALLESACGEDGIDGDVDLVQLLMERAGDEDRAMLRQRFTDVFLVFDLDPQDPRYDPDRIDAALRHFDDSTDNGKLYINYPMLESYRHMSFVGDPSYMDRTVMAEDIRRYKRIVGEQGCQELKDLGRITREQFTTVIMMNLEKANRILGGTGVPSAAEYLGWGGSDIFAVQRRMLESEGKLYVLNTSLFNPVDFMPHRMLV